MERRESRLAKNEALFREVNERIAEITEGLANSHDLDGVVCECADSLCLERIGPLSIAEYERVRRDSRRFIIVANHHSPDVESIVERHDNYWIVQKHEGVPAEVARKMDERN